MRILSHTGSLQLSATRLTRPALLRTWLWCALRCVFALSLCPCALFGQGRREVIRGLVTNDSGAIVPGAIILVTTAPNRETIRGTSDSLGMFALVIPNGQGDYLLHVSIPTHKPFRKRIVRSPTAAASDSSYEINVQLAAAAQELAPVRIEASRPKPSRDAERGAGVGGAENIPDMFLGAIIPEQLGDIAAIAATGSGINPVTGGYSALGLSPGQNSATLNGMAFSGAALPRDAPVRTRVATTAYDPARGWFSGANASIDVIAGGLYAFRNAHATLDAPQLQYGEASGSSSNGFTMGNLSLGGSGPINDDDKYFYSYGVQARQRMAPLTSLTQADPLLLARTGVARDSVVRLFQLLETQGLSIALKHSKSALTTRNLSGLARFDRSPYDRVTLAPSKSTLAVILFGDLARSEPVAIATTATSGHGGRRSNAAAQILGLYSTYFGDDYLTELRSGLSLSRQEAAPELEIPDASVFVSSDLGGNYVTSNALSFGGNSSLESSSKQWTWETISETQFYPARGAAHRIKVTANARLDGYGDSDGNNSLGTFTFASLSDLAANKPTLYTRHIGAHLREGGEWNGFIAIGDLWRVGPSLQVLYGIRAEANAFTANPSVDQDVAQALGARTDAVPNSWHVSPRLGFTWVRRGAANAGAIRFNPMGQFNLAPTSYLRGGIGEFRGLLPAALITDGFGASRGAQGGRQISCFGAAAPSPDWAGYLTGASAPSHCAANASAALTDTLAERHVVDPAFSPPRSWRGNLSYASQTRWLTYSIEGIYSLNLDQPGAININLHAAPSFVTADEARPVFLPEAAIASSSGVLAPAAARLASQLGPVISQVSNLKSVSRQLTIAIAPDLFGVSNVYASLAYTLSNVRAFENGFDATTFGDPMVREWSRSRFDIRHSVLMRAGLSKGGVTFTVFGRAQSGVPFTPLISQDVNGDGFRNDRAFVHSPTGTQGMAEAAAMRALLESSRPRIRSCLTTQFDKVAARGSCEGPWNIAMNGQLTMSGPAMHLPARVSAVALSIANPIAGVDQLLHGSEHLHGWGLQLSPDPILYNVRGFDAQARQFKYELNSHFGSADPQRSLERTPFRLTIDVSVNLGREITLQQLERSLRPGRAGRPGSPFTVAELQRRYARNVPDPYDAILRETDSLLLSSQQVLELRRAQARLQAETDSLWRGLAVYLSGLGDTYDAKAALDRQEHTIADVWTTIWADARRTLPLALSPVQLGIVPGIANALLRSEVPYRPGGRTLR